MDDEIPIACTLTGAQMPERLAEIAAIGRDSLVSVEDALAVPVLLFRDDSQTRERLEAVVAAESRCCAFLKLDLREDFDGLRLTISGPNAAAPIVSDLVGAFRGAPPRERPRADVTRTDRRGRRRGDVAILGSGVLMVLCCVIGPRNRGSRRRQRHRWVAGHRVRRAAGHAPPQPGSAGC